MSRIHMRFIIMVIIYGSSRMVLVDSRTPSVGLWLAPTSHLQWQMWPAVPSRHTWKRQTEGPLSLLGSQQLWLSPSLYPDGGEEGREGGREGGREEGKEEGREGWIVERNLFIVLAILQATKKSSFFFIIQATPHLWKGSQNFGVDCEAWEDSGVVPNPKKGQACNVLSHEELRYVKTPF